MNEILKQRMYELDGMMFDFGYEVIVPKGVQGLGDAWYDYWVAFADIRHLLFPNDTIMGPRFRHHER